MSDNVVFATVLGFGPTIIICITWLVFARGKREANFTVVFATVLINTFSGIIVPVGLATYKVDCLSVIVSYMPALWAVVVLIGWRTTTERICGYLAGLLALLWPLYTWRLWETL